MLVLLPLEGAEHAFAGLTQLLPHETLAVYCLPVQEVYRQHIVPLDVLQREHHQRPLHVDVRAVCQAGMPEGVQLLPDAQVLRLAGSHVLNGLLELQAAQADRVDFVDFHGLVGGAALEGQRLAVEQMLVGQIFKLLEEKVFVLGVGLYLSGEGGVLLSELLLL